MDLNLKLKQIKATRTYVSYDVPLAPNARREKKMQDGRWQANLKPIRKKRYKLMQRENRIVKKAIDLGVTVSGY